MIKNLAPPKLRTDEYGITQFWKKASPAQKQVARNFERTHWLVHAASHVNKKDWFLTFARYTYHLGSGEDEIKTCHEESIKLQIDRKGKTKNYWTKREAIITPEQTHENCKLNSGQG